MVNRCIIGWKAVMGKFQNAAQSEKDLQACQEYEKYQVDLTSIIQMMSIDSNRQMPDLLNEVELFKLKTQNPVLPSGFDGSSQLAQLCYCSVRLLKPSIIVETGVSRGVTSAIILQAININKKGKLYSIDLPYLGQVIHNDIGIYIPSNLRSEWKLLLGTGLNEMTKLKKQLTTIDIFIHDSDHSYANQLAEYRLAWPWIKKGGILISDDVKNRAFLDFCAENALNPNVLKQNKDSGFVGIIRKI